MINVFTVAQALKEEGWTLLSEEYKNLHTPLTMQCPKGHKCELSYEEWRKYKLCPQCWAGDTKKVKKGVGEKKGHRLLALDLATNTSGFALYEDKDLIHYGTFTTVHNDAADRIHQVILWLAAIIDQWQPDEVGIEDIQLQQNDRQEIGAKTFQALANLQGAVQEWLYAAQQPYYFVPVASWRKVCGIVGRNRSERKKAAQQLVERHYGFSPTQDEADAICIGKYCLKKEFLDI